MPTVTRFVLAYAVNSVWQLPLLLLAAEIVARVLGRTHGRVLCRLWLMVLTLALVWPALSLVPVSFHPTSAVVPVHPAIQQQPAAIGNPTQSAGATERSPVHFGFQNSQSDDPGEIDRAFSKLPGMVSSCILYLYLGSIVVAGTRFGRGLWATHRLMHTAEVAKLDEELETTWRSCQTSMGVTKIGLLSAPRLSSPATLYWPKPIVLVPPSLEGADAAEMSAVFCHELAHVIRRDFIWNLAAEITGVLLFYHPAFHWMRRRIRETRELACDDLAAEVLSGRRNYARNLLSFTQKTLSLAVISHPGSALGIFEGEVLERRIMNLLGKRSRLPVLRTAASAILGAGFVIATAAVSTNYGMRLVHAQSNLQTSGAPKGWHMAGSQPANYGTGLDRAVVNNGQPSAFLRSTVANTEGFGTLMQSFSAADYVGKRVRLRAWVKSQDVGDWAGIWMRVDKEQTMVAFDNMQNRAIKGTQGWKVYDVVLDVPQGSTGISFGILLSGTGEVWMNDVSFEIVGPDVPVTGNASQNLQRPARPANLKFTE